MTDSNNKKNKKKDKKKKTILSYMSDILFKYLLTRLNPLKSRKVLNFITLNVLGFIDPNLTLTSPELSPINYKQKGAIVDTRFISSKLSLIIEMQATTMTKRLWNRFILYVSIVSSELIHSGQDYNNAQPTCMILFAKYYDKKSKSLVLEKSWADLKSGKKVNQSCQKIYVVQIPYIKEIIKERTKLTDFEAFVYYLYFNHLEGIEFEDKDGILKMMQEEKEKFMREEKDMYNDALERLQFTFDYDGLAEESKKEGIEEGREEGIEEGIEIGEEKRAKKNAIQLFKNKHPNEDTNFLNNLTLNQYTQIFDSLIDDKSLRQIKALCL